MNKLEKVILFVFLLLTLSGALRKWIIDNAIINIILTAIPLLSTFIILFFYNRSLPQDRKLYNSQYSKLLVVFLFCLIPMAANPLNLTAIHGIVGILIHSSFWLLLFAYLSNRDIINLKKLFPYFIIMSVIQVGIGLLQYNSSPDAAINQYTQSDISSIYNDVKDIEEDLVHVATVGNATRSSGTFSYIGGYSSYIFFTIYLFISYYNKSKNAYVLIALFTLSLLGTLTTGSRSSLIIFTSIIIAFFAFQTKEKGFLIKMLSIASLLIVLNIGLGDIMGIQKQFVSSTENITERILTNQEEGSRRISGPINSLISPETPYPFVGIGLGASYQGINSLFGSSEYNSGTEHEIGRTLIDGGFILLFLKFALFFFMIKNLEGNIFFYIITLPIIFLTTLITTNPYTNFYLVLGIMLLDNILYMEKRSHGKNPQ